MNILQSTQIMVSLALNVQKNTDGAITLKVFNILSLTSFLFLIWQFGQFLNTSKSGLYLLISDLFQVGVIIGKVFSIGINSLVYGVGGVV